MDSITGTVLSVSGLSGYDDNGGDFDILRDLLLTADALNEAPFAGLGLVAALDTLPDLTVFAPVDDAFTGLATTIAAVTGNDAPMGEAESVGFLADTLTLLGKGDASGLLTDILTYHVAPGVFELADVVALGDGAAVPTLLGSTLTTEFDTPIPSLIDGDPGLPDPSIIATDIGATNGVIHAIDGVLLPIEVSAILTQEDTDFRIGDASGEWFATGRGDDFIDGNGGRDIIRAGSGNDVAIGGDGNDLIAGGRGRDVLLGEDGHDKIMGGRGRDDISGGTGDDIILGGSGNDVIEGGAGDDWLVGGHGNDTFVFNKGDGHDVVLGSWNGKDKIDLSGYDGVDEFADIAHNIHVNLFGTTIELDHGDSIQLLGVWGHQLDASDFVFEDTMMV